MFTKRLHPQELLYCEGRNKPRFRGVMHMIFFFLNPLGLLYLKNHSISFIGDVASYVVCFTIATCLGISGIYHKLKWRKNDEIFLQKLDHACISLVAAGSYFPLALFMMNFEKGILLVLLLILSCICTFMWILQGRQSLVPLLICTCIAFPFLISVETSIMIQSLSVIFIYGIGMCIFKMRKPDPYPNVFGYHEVFHVFVIISMIMTYFVHSQTVSRKSTWFD